MSEKFVETKFYKMPQGELLNLESGLFLSSLTIAYETHGSLNKDKTNVILLCHALSGDAHVAGYHVADDKPGWWAPMVGPGKAFDTEKYFIICSNVIGSCKGSSGPNSINPETGKPFGLSFPIVTVKDMVNAQKKLLDFLGIKKILSVAGGSMGGMQVLQWVKEYPEMIMSAIPIATTYKHFAQQIAFNEVGRQAIMADPAWNNGDYYGKEAPSRGLAVARMIGHITYMSSESMDAKFGRSLKNKELGYEFATEFEIEGYLGYRGDSFVKRFDANSYLYITKAMDYFDIQKDKNLIDVFKGVSSRFLIITFSSDWLYTPAQNKELVRALKMNGIDVTYCEIGSSYGHDAFLIEFDEQTKLIKHFLEKTFKTL
ncbi:homoserine O-acetyltransferase [Candidatus Omnitrophus magneticus]|uniref:Homoserine O-acetyltransferase n=1 Tax=Candidatus Omnitrophus magneticus TaxID=1609969 RepID=A0A0F0CRM9_9BACT|nr:homoserine O-acetyltransferase [Candidatus Omnitrophus magneticus]